MITFPEILLRLVVSILLCGLIGWEREYSDHNAGVRTSSLVALGTTLFTIISAYAFRDLLNQPHVQFDPTRIASYIVAGIGFLGGGAIYFRQDLQKVRGLTSAASVWVVAAIGMACGIGFLLEAAVTTIMALFILIGMRYVEARFLPYKSHHMQELFIRIDSDEEGTVVGKIYDILNDLHIDIERVDIHSQKLEQEIVRTLEIGCRASDARTLMQALDRIRVIKGVQSIKSSTRKGVGPE
ncbi:MgtC/SapB family protein [Dictyobacter kobayashii]|uniref:Methyltransferase n=1 Tax=Dictyobacter kobayashii TaxID=2014872 RepID=A0A402AS13_9CHLR|nr:MgtC/SapB family protein [Dictyobacter kobayashii]GCE21843.1 methyltransferase [Dictyobacter kobayashii]